jgi:hypothetical protein
MNCKYVGEKAGIANSLLDFAYDEGRPTALDKIDDWRDAVEEMMEVANPDQFTALSTVKNSIDWAASLLCDPQYGFVTEDGQGNWKLAIKKRDEIQICIYESCLVGLRLKWLEDFAK